MTLRQLITGAPRYVPSTPWPATWAIAATVLIVVASQAVVALLFALLGGFEAQVASGAGDQGAVGTLMLWLVLTQAVAVALVLLAAHAFGGRAREVLQLGGNGIGPGTLASSILLMAAVLGAYNLVVYWLRPSDMLGDLQLYADFIRSDAWLLAALAIGVGAPLMEELLFRGFLQSALAQSRLGFWPGAVLGTAAWTLLHWGYSGTGLGEVFLIGIFFSWLLWKTGSLLPALFCHALYNSALTVALRMAPTVS